MHFIAITIDTHLSSAQSNQCKIARLQNCCLIKVNIHDNSRSNFIALIKTELKIVSSMPVILNCILNRIVLTEEALKLAKTTKFINGIQSISKTLTLTNISIFLYANQKCVAPAMFYIELCQTPSLARCSRNSRESSREFPGMAHRKFRAKNMTPFLFYQYLLNYTSSAPMLAS